MKKLKKILIIFILVLIIFEPNISYADMGPKPSVYVNIKGIEGNEVYYMTLLSEDHSTGPFSYGNDIQRSQIGNEDGFNKFLNIKDKDGYFFISYVEKLRGDDEFSWTYYPPNKFKIALYFPNRELVLISKPMERYAFSSYFDLEYDELGIENDTYYFKDQEIKIEKSINIKREVGSFFIRVIITILL